MSDGHRCPRRRSIVAIELIASALAGGFALWLLQAAFDPLGQIADMDVLSFAAGAVAGVVINRFARS